jgi:hypothetical protein
MAMSETMFISIMDLAELLNIRYDSAGRIHRAVRDSLNKKSKLLSLQEYCDYEELNYEEVLNFLKNKNNKNGKNG